MSREPVVREPDSGDGRTDRGLRTRAALADAALRLFFQRGFDAVTVEEVAAAAGVSSRTFFRHFASKEDALFADADAQVERLRAELADRPADEPVRVAVRRAVTALAAGYEGRQDRLVMRAAIAEDAPVVATRAVGTLADLEDVIGRFAAERLGTDPGDLGVRVLATSTVGALRAATEVWLERGAVADLAALVGEALALVQDEPVTAGG